MITRRKLTSYAKVQALVGMFLRNRRSQLRRQRISQRKYLDIGCGLNTHSDFINLDYRWHPDIDVCWDITKGLPFGDRTLDGVFTEHCLEHFTLDTSTRILSEVHRVLRPEASVRIAVPDGQLYIETYLRQLRGDHTAQFPYSEVPPASDLHAPILGVNRLFYQDRESLAGHRTIFDFDLMKSILTSVGFRGITRCEFREGRDPRLLIDSEFRKVESLYVEARAGD